ncbi:MAG: hypothetical protein V7609_872 [Verrucomicrobiota bacterium]
MTMDTDLMSRHPMNLTRCTFFATATVCFLFLYAGNGAADSREQDPWHDAHPFTTQLDQGVKFGEPINPRKPPPLSVWLLSSSSGELRAMADYINLGRKRVTLHGRRIKDATDGVERFYPYARLEVSNQTDREWQVIGDSPPATAGVSVAIAMVPIKIGVANPKAKSNPSCTIDMKLFKKFVGKFRYGRIVLKDGGTSQMLGLDDLLPPKDAFR